MGARILFRDSRGRDGSLPLSAGEPCVVGRALDCAIRSDDALVSRQHSVIRMENGRFFVEDLGSSNGTHVNDARVSKHELSHNDVVRCGSLWLRFVEEESPAAAEASARTAEGKTRRVEDHELDDLVSQLKNKKALIPTVSGLEAPTVPRTQGAAGSQPDESAMELAVARAALVRAEATQDSLQKELERLRKQKRELEEKLAQSPPPGVGAAGEATARVSHDRNPAVLQDRALVIEEQASALIERALREIEWMEVRNRDATEAQHLATIKAAMVELQVVVGTLRRLV